MLDHQSGGGDGFNRRNVYGFIINLLILAFVVAEWGDDLYRWIESKFSM